MSDCEISARQKKELKGLESEKRQALKKIKTTMGKSKKGKDALSAAEAEWKWKEEETLTRHKLELLPSSGGEKEVSIEISDCSTADNDKNNNEEAVVVVSRKEEANIEVVPVVVRTKQEKALEKKRAKRRAALQKEKEREERIEQENKEAGPSAKDMELQALKILIPDNLQIKEIPADGHCLYRAIASQTSFTYTEMRHLAAEELSNHREEYEPFFIVDDNDSNNVVSFDQHIQQVRNTAEWGGHIELRALAKALHRTIMVYSTTTTTSSPLTIDSGDNNNNDKQILLTYHRHYYALGEHYNSLIAK